jgi:short/branched chain acyl-CoA dehydrogenase
VLPRPSLAATLPRRAYSTEDGSLPQIASLNTFTEEEIAMRDMVSKFASEVIAPKVKAMDEAEVMDPEVIKALFENGLMGIEVEPEFGGAGASFVSSLIAVEEISRVDPTVSIIVVGAQATH